ncbi:O-antigen ligase family protein [Flavobacterium daemonense]|uniref:O-antigen ligase family protein n=1 Tax=Flavobacterium daemonense TaxID=1393049 RepID=UPI0011872A26|nr:hypothetical protein [Flavobacterium daemonense]KAF2332508.1 hypothetical protein FND99_12000 [Flavobacterium daemonense]
MKFLFKRKNINYLYVFLIIGYSTIPLLRNVFIGYICFFLAVFHVGELIKYRQILFLIFSLFLLEIYHLFYFAPDYDISVVRTVLFSFIIGFGFANQCRFSFLIIYIKIIHFFSIVSLVIFTMLIISESLVKKIESFFDPAFKLQYLVYDSDITQVNPIFYNFDYNFYNVRNNGPFWEPTIFAALLILSIIFNIIIFKDTKNKYLIVSLITLITTFSSTGYIAAVVLMIMILLFSDKIKLHSKILLITIFLGIFFTIYNNTSFLEKKITSEYSDRNETIFDKGGDSRIASMILDWKEITEKPEYFVFGKGTDKRTRIGTRDKNVLRNNGFTALLVQRGIFFLLFYLFGIYYTFYVLCKLNGRNTMMALAFLLSILILSFSEILFDLVVFHVIVFLGFVLRYNLINKKKIITNANSINNYLYLEQ